MTNHHLVLLPILLPLTASAVALLLRRRPRVQAAWALCAMVTSLAFSLLLLLQVWRGQQAVVFQTGGWAAPWGISLVGDYLSVTLVVMSQIVLSMGILYALGSNDSVVKYPGFYPLFLTLATGLSGALLTGDLFNLFVFAELMVFSGTILTACSDDRYGTEAAFKYFYISLVGSTSLLLGVGCLYVSYGATNMASLASGIMADPQKPLVPLAIAFLMTTFMIKSAVVPFHFWQPDFHTAAPTPVHAVLSSVVVKLGLYGFMRMTSLLFLAQADTVRGILLVTGIIGVFYGGLGATGTYDAKRMLAYSTIGQIGFILVALGWGTPLAMMAAIVFAFNHSLIKSAMLMLAGTVASRARVKTAAFQAITGLGKYMPFTGLLFLIGGLALAGVPPTNGFISKLVLFRSGIEAEQYTALLLIGLASILTLVYIVRAFQAIWWQPPAPEALVKPAGDRLLAPALLIGTVLVLGLWPEPLIRLAEITAAWLGSPDGYIHAVLGG
jgi:multicomponent Na+:H+ antiporter subunit D